MDDLNISTENLQLFMDAFYKNIHINRITRKNKKNKDQFSYHEGNKVKYIQSIEVFNCSVANKTNMIEDLLIVKYINNDNILCSFSLLLNKLNEYDLQGKHIHKKLNTILPPI